MNFIGKQETLEEDLKNILLKAGFKEIIHKKKKNINKNRIDYNYYKTYYTEYAFNFVNNHFEKDFIEFNYKKYDNYNYFMTDAS